MGRPMTLTDEQLKQNESLQAVIDIIGRWQVSEHAGKRDDPTYHIGWQEGLRLCRAIAIRSLHVEESEDDEEGDTNG